MTARRVAHAFRWAAFRGGPSFALFAKGGAFRPRFFFLLVPSFTPDQCESIHRPFLRTTHTNSIANSSARRVARPFSDVWFRVSDSSRFVGRIGISAILSAPYLISLSFQTRSPLIRVTPHRSSPIHRRSLHEINTNSTSTPAANSPTRASPDS